jgi:hypothetical protein
MRKLNVRLLVLFGLATAATYALLWALADRRAYPFEHEAPGLRTLASQALYTGLAATGGAVLVLHWRRDAGFQGRMTVLTTVLVVCVAFRAAGWGRWPDVSVLPSVALETARAVGASFAIAFLAHVAYARYLPTTLLRIRDITPVVWEGRGGAPARVRHCGRAMWLFGLSGRRYLDTTRLRLEPEAGAGFRLADWLRSTRWALALLLAFSTYIEVYPSVSRVFRGWLTSLMAANLLSLIPFLLLTSYPLQRLGARVPVGRNAFEVSEGFRGVGEFWVTASFVPIFIVGFLARIFVWENAPDMVAVLLLGGPVVAMVNLVYLECLQDRTVREVLTAIPERERAERGMWGADPWTERSLVEGAVTGAGRTPGEGQGPLEGQGPPEGQEE